MHIRLSKIELEHVLCALAQGWDGLDVDGTDDGLDATYTDRIVALAGDAANDSYRAKHAIGYLGAPLFPWDVRARMGSNASYVRLLFGR